MPEVVPYHDAPPQSGIECLGVDVVVRGRTERRLLRTAIRSGRRRCARAGVARASAARASRPRVRSRPRSGRSAGSLSRAAAVRTLRRTAPVCVGLPRASSRRAADRSTGTAVRTGDLVVCRLDREEARQRGLTGGVGVVGLRQPAIRTLDIGEGRPSLEAERAVRIRIEGHGLAGAPGSAGRARSSASRWERRRQPISSPTGASSNSGMDSAPTRPCGSRMVGRW